MKYKTRLQKPREGVCSAWIATLAPSTRVPLRIIPGTMLLPADPSVPVLAIGPGTGIAPIRSIVQERIAVSSTVTDNTVVVGCRYSHRDFILKAEWEKLADNSANSHSPELREPHAKLVEIMQNSTLRRPLVYLYVAASRDQPEKVYVQDILRSNAAKVWNILGTRRGIAYLSG